MDGYTDRGADCEWIKKKRKKSRNLFIYTFSRRNLFVRSRDKINTNLLTHTRTRWLCYIHCVCVCRNIVSSTYSTKGTSTRALIGNIKSCPVYYTRMLRYLFVYIYIMCVVYIIIITHVVEWKYKLLVVWVSTCAVQGKYKKKTLLFPRGGQRKKKIARRNVRAPSSSSCRWQYYTKVINSVQFIILPQSSNNK